MDTQQTFDHREIDVRLNELPLSYAWAGPSSVAKRSLSHAPKPALGAAMSQDDYFSLTQGARAGARSRPLLVLPRQLRQGLANDLT